MRLIGIFALLLFMSVSAVAQQPAKNEEIKAEGRNKEDCVMMKNNKLLIMRNGMTTEMTHDIQLNDGSSVSTSGIVRMKDGSSRMIKNNELVTMSGKWEKLEKYVDPLDTLK
jgi:hypothetical protein